MSFLILPVAGTTIGPQRGVAPPRHSFGYGSSARLALRPASGTITRQFRHDTTLGWHPYFPRRSQSRLRIAVATRWEQGQTQLPTHSVAIAGIDADPACLALDHCHSGWRAPAWIGDEQFALTLEVSANLNHLVVFTPPGREYFCIEPVSHVSDAIHHDDPQSLGLVALPPGAIMQAWLTLQVQPLTPLFP